MSSTATPAPGGTGFLFGNIDTRGRLDAEYLSDDAKDNIENVRPAVRDNHLYHVDAAPSNAGKARLSGPVSSLPPASRAHPTSDNESYDDDDDNTPHPTAAGEDAEDFADIDSDNDGLDEQEREQFAKRALATVPAAFVGPRSTEQDEDYDPSDDDEDGIKTSKQTPISSVPSATTNKLLTTSTVAQSGSAPAHDGANAVSVVKAIAPPTASPKKSSPLSISPSPSPVSAEQQALLQQRKLLAEARAAVTAAPPEGTNQNDTSSPPATPERPSSPASPLLFSDMLTFSPPRLRFRRRRNRRLGVPVASPTPKQPSIAPDEAARLMRPSTPPKLDPVAVAIAADDPVRCARFPPPRRTAPPPRLRPAINDDEYRAAAAPLDPESTIDISDSKSSSFLDGPPHLVRQIAWEQDILWRDGTENHHPNSADKGDGHATAAEEINEDEDDDDADAWEDLAVPITSSSENILKSSKIGDDFDDDDDDDDDDFEDAVVVNKEAPPKANIQDSDSDDDMEWEDGDVSSPKPTEAPPPKPVPSETVKSTQPNLVAPNLSETKARNADNSTLAPSIETKGSQIPLPPGCQLVKSLLAPNHELDGGGWVRGILWDSASDGEGASDATTPGDVYDLNSRFDHLILDLNDKNMCFEEEQPSDDDDDDRTTADVRKQSTHPGMVDAALTPEQMKLMVTSSGAAVHQALQNDICNVSNDLYYASGASHGPSRIDRSSIMRGLQNAPPALKVQTTPSAMTDAELLSFHRPKLTKSKIPKTMTLAPVRRKRPRGGTSQIAGQMPKRKSDLLCSEKDAYRVSLFEYALERQPCLLPVPGMASRLLTYAREESAVAAANAFKQAAGTPDSDTIFMCPDEAPPLVAGNIEAGDKKLSVIESHLYAAPCVKHDAPTTDFLLVRQGKHMYVREIDSVMSLGVTEPKFEVMAPNTERYKKYSRERMVLWVMREFQRMRKEISKAEKKNKDKEEGESSKPIRNPPYIEKEEIFKEFPRRRTYPETGLIRALKEMSRFHNGKYMMAEDVAKNYSQREAELLRILTPLETSAFEAMESGWEQIIDRGIGNFTHPSGQGNILTAAETERSGLEAGPAVGKYIKTLLLKTPWYRSHHIVSSHKAQRKDLLQALFLARIVNDLREGGTATEERLMTLSNTDMNNVLTQVFRYNSKKIPMDVEERRSLVRELSQRKGKGAPSADVTDYPTIIRTVLKKHRDAGLSKGAAIAAAGTPMAGGTFLGIQLDIQRRALEEGDVDDLPAEEDDFEIDENTRAILAAGDSAFGKKPPPKKKEISSTLNKKKSLKLPMSSATVRSSVKLGVPSETTSITIPASAAITPSKPPPALTPLNKSPEKEKSLKSANPSEEGSGMDDAKKSKKKITRIKVTKKVKVNGKLTPQVSYVTDPKEITRILEKNKGNNNNNEKAKTGVSEDRPAASSGNLKIAIGLNSLQGGVSKKKKNVVPSEKPKSKKKSPPKDDSAAPTQKKSNEKGQIGKIKINTKHLQRDKEQAALKRKRSQYGDDIEYRAKKTAKTIRRKRNGRVELNNILEKIESIIRQTEGYLVPNVSKMTVARLKDGESPPPGVTATNLAKPAGTGLDFTVPVDPKAVPMYKDFVKDPMYLNLIKANCKQGKYNTASEFIGHMQLMADNARAFNRASDDQWVVQHAQLLLDVAKEQVSRRVEDIKAAEDMIKLEDIETKNSGTGPLKGKNKNKSKVKTKGKSKGKGQSEGKGNDKRKNKGGTVGKDGVITITDDADSGSKAPKRTSKSGRGSGVIDLDGDSNERTNGEISNPLDSSPPPLAPPGVLNAGLTDDIYTMGGSEDHRDDYGQSGDHIVLDL